MHFKIIKDLSNPSSGSEVAAMVMDEVKLKMNIYIAHLSIKLFNL